LCVFQVPEPFKDEMNFRMKMHFWPNTQARESQECITTQVTTTLKLTYAMVFMDFWHGPRRKTQQQHVTTHSLTTKLISCNLSVWI
jgi:hypothetical protein